MDGWMGVGGEAGARRRASRCAHWVAMTTCVRERRSSYGCTMLTWLLPSSTEHCISRMSALI